MKLSIKSYFLFIMMFMTMWSCTKTSAHGTITMVMSGSVHGQLDPCGWKKNPLGGLSRKYVKIKEMRDAGIDPLILDAGDLFFSTKNIDATNKNSEIFRANAIMEGFQKVGCDAINVGHYEVLNGLSFLREMVKKTDIPFISSNLKDSKSGQLLFDPYKRFVMN